MNGNSENIYLEALAAHQLPHAIGAVALPHLARAFSQMAKDLRSQDAPAAQQEAFQSAIAGAAESARYLTAPERKAVQSTLFTAFDGLPRRHSAMPVRADFLRQVRFPPSRVPNCTDSAGPLALPCAYPEPTVPAPFFASPVAGSPGALVSPGGHGSPQ